MLTRHDFLKWVGIAAAALTLPPWINACVSNRQQPNILFIMSDDHAANAISCYDSWLAGILKTPNIDRIANEGALLKKVFCTNSICTPSRASILTGQYGHLNGVRTLDDTFNRDQKHVAKDLQNSGYETAVIGKWHLHTEPSGFDYYNVLPNQGRYFDPILKEKGKPWKDRKKGGQVYPGYVTDVITDQTIKWLKNRRNEKPFFLMCHHKAPHGLWELAPRHVDLYKGIDIPEPLGFWENQDHRSPGSKGYGSNLFKLGQRMSRGSAGKEWPTGKLNIDGMSRDEIKKAAYQKYMKDYLRCVAAIDENVGRLLEYLDQSGLAENTVVIYTSDQGQFLGEHDYYDKRWMYEESMKMPFVIRYPREIKPGTVNENLITNNDFAPTFLDLAGSSKSEYMQGQSFRSILRGRTPPNWRTAVYYRYWMHMAHHNVPAHYGIRTKCFKLMFFYGLPLGVVGRHTSSTLDKDPLKLDQFKPTSPGWELYDLQKDPRELQNVYNDPAYAEVVKGLKQELLRLKQKYRDTDEQYPELMAVRKKYWE